MKNLLFPGANTAINDAFTGSARQLTVDTTRWELRLHDGVTPGGHRILNLEQLLLIFMAKDSEFGEVAFGDGELGYLVRVGDRQYELRQITGSDGITVENGLATSANTNIKIDQDWLDDQLQNLISGGILFRLTEGTASALTTTIPVINPDFGEEGEPETVTDIAWPLDGTNGALLGVEFHIAVADDATLAINGQTGKPIKLPTESVNLDQTLRIGTQAILMMVDNQWIVVGMQQAKHVPIDPITDLNIDDDPVTPARNVQEALEALKALIDGGGAASGLSGYYVFGSLSAVPSGFKLSDVLTESGKCMIMRKAGTAATGTGEVSTPGRPPEVYYVVRDGTNYYMGRIFTGLSYEMSGSSLIVTHVTMPDYDSAGLYGPPGYFKAIPDETTAGDAIAGWGSYMKTAVKP